MICLGEVHRNEVEVVLFVAVGTKSGRAPAAHELVRLGFLKEPVRETVVADLAIFMPPVGHPVLVRCPGNWLVKFPAPCRLIFLPHNKCGAYPVTM